MAEALQEEGYDVAMAINGREALRVLVSLEGPCLVLLDLEIPRVDGQAFLERLKTDSRFLGTRVVGMTAEPGPVPPGVSAVMRKPVRLEALLDMVSQHCPPRDAGPTSMPA